MATRLFSRKLDTIENSVQRIWPKFINVGNKRTGRDYYKLHFDTQADAILKWPNRQLKRTLDVIGWTYETPEQIYAKQKILDMYMKGKKPTRKFEGKKSKRRG